MRVGSCIEKPMHVIVKLHDVGREYRAKGFARRPVERGTFLVLIDNWTFEEGM